MIQNNKTVRVEWIDSKSGPDEWERWDDLEPLAPVICKTVGYLVEDTDDYKILASTISGKFVLGRLAIPSGCILKSTILNEIKKDLNKFKYE